MVLSNSRILSYPVAALVGGEMGTSCRNVTRRNMILNLGPFWARGKWCVRLFTTWPRATGTTNLTLFGFCLGIKFKVVKVIFGGKFKSRLFSNRQSVCHRLGKVLCPTIIYLINYRQYNRRWRRCFSPKHILSTFYARCNYLSCIQITR